MTVTRWLRAVVLVGVAAAVVDPGCTRARPAAVHVVAGPSATAADRDAVHAAVSEAGLAIEAAARPDTIRVGLGQPRELLDLSRAAALDLAVRFGNARPHVIAIAAPPASVVGIVSELRVRVGGVVPGSRPLSVEVSDAQRGRRLGSADVRLPVSEADADDPPTSAPWVGVPVLPVEPGRWALCVTVGGDEAPQPPRDACERIDLLVAPATVRVHVFEARPSWAARFARIAIARWDEARVTSVVRVAPRIDVGAGPSPAARRDRDAPTAAPAITPAQSGREADVTIVAGLEALTAADVAPLVRRVEDDGHAVVILADGPIPAGRLGRLWPGLEAEVRTRATPVPVDIGGHQWRVREWLAPGPWATGAEPLAYVEAAPRAPVLWGRALGQGHVVVVGAIDAWRWRAESPEPHDGAWQALLLSVAAMRQQRGPVAWRVPSGLGDDVQIALPAAGRQPADPAALPEAVRATMMRADGGWRGVLPAGAGDATLADVQVEGDGVAWPVAGAETVPAGWPDVQRELGAAGGRVVDAPALAPALRALAGGRERTGPRWFVSRQWWYAAGLLAALGLEWWGRRRAFAR